MTAKNWLKDVLLCCVILAGIASIAAYLLAAERLEAPDSFAAPVRRSVMDAASKLDAAMDKDIRSENLQIATPANESQIFRRLALSLAGTLPSVEEIRELEKIDQHDRVDWYVSRLLEDTRSADYLAERLARAFVGLEEGPFLVYRRNRFVSWLSEKLKQNTAYDELTRQLLTSNGIWTDKPEVNFYTYNIIPDSDNENKPDPIRLAGRTSRAFLGMRIDCLQCHDDFLGTMNLGGTENPVGGLQRHFHSLASFFSQVENSLVGIRDNLDAKPYLYKLLEDEQPTRIEAEVPFNPSLDDRSQTNLRQRLASWVTHKENRPYARAAVNRVWAMMFGQGYIQPVDDIPLEGPFPAGLELLVDEFVQNGYDLHRLIRIIASSQVFQRDSSAKFEIHAKHTETYAVFPMIRLRPEQVAGSIIQSTSLKTIDSTAHIVSRLIKYGQELEFVSRFGDPGENEFNDKSETITQRLLMMNGEMVSDRLHNGLNSVTRLAMLSPDMTKAVDTIFLATLSRHPTATESKYFVQQLSELSGEKRRLKIADIYWVLINSVEFVWNH